MTISALLLLSMRLSIEIMARSRISNPRALSGDPSPSCPGPPSKFGNAVMVLVRTVQFSPPSTFGNAVMGIATIAHFVLLLAAPMPKPTRHDHSFCSERWNEMVIKTPRSMAFLRNMGDQVETPQENALTFDNNPIEAQLLIVMMRLLKIKASLFCSVAPQDVEVLVLIYSMNSSSNLHAFCHNLYAFTPSPFLSIWTQTVVRVVRFGNPSSCVIIAYITERAFNTQ
ncbi:hypothetical protein IQ07DRAFT_678478 [Pyrenochaeta sp. DS3sAY3a]|nr:hypothetical protein IQ07DRAFT_678478 [Pyrenochaeta sp. DS3sAY3a]